MGRGGGGGGGGGGGREAGNRGAGSRRDLYRNAAGLSECSGSLTRRIPSDAGGPSDNQPKRFDG